MTLDISERAFEEAIERDLLEFGPDAHPEGPNLLRESAPPWGAMPPGGYLKRHNEDYDRGLCLLPRDTVDFLLATQPKAWAKLEQHHRDGAREQVLRRIASEIERRGALDVLRHGIKDSGVKLHLAYFPPASGLNPDTQRLYAGNLFSIVRQLHYSSTSEASLDLGLFLNGLPLFTAELKNPLNGQNVHHAIRQYRSDRDPREPLFALGRCLAHFAVDPELVYVTTHLSGADTRFLPFNQGKFGGAGNPPVLGTRGGYATAYLWQQTWAKDSVLELVRQFIQDIHQEDHRGRKTGQRTLIFPRFHQVDCVRKLVHDAEQRGPGQRYLIQHSAGSGKSLTIAWLAHRLATLHGVADRRVFDSIVVVTDRRVLDRQLQSTMRELEQQAGVVENIDTTSRQLKAALEEGKTIIVTTLQKFPVIAREIGELPGKRFALIIDEAHSSQSGERSKSLKAVLNAGSLAEAAETEEAAETPEEELESLIVAEMAKRGPLPNVSTFAFTATPKDKTLELFGTRRDDGKFDSFHLYQMRQAIEEGFILDVLASYTTYQAYWRLLKTVAEDPHYDKNKAAALLKSFVDLHPHSIHEKVRIVLDHFSAQVQGEIGGRAKAMIVTRSRLHAVRTKRVLDRVLAERGSPWKALVAFSGTVEDGADTYTEAGMNGFPEAQTAATFDQPEMRFLVVANKFQTGFDQPLLAAMYVDKKLGSVNAVQTLSRLNRTHPHKKRTVVLDFANEAEAIRKAFEPYYETTLLSEATDPNLLYELEGRLIAFGVFTRGEVESFARIYYDPKATQDLLYAALAPARERFTTLLADEQSAFRAALGDYARLYAFLAQVLTFTDADLEKLYVFARHLRRQLPFDPDELPHEVQQSIDMESYRLQETSSGSITLERRPGVLEPMGSKRPHADPPEEREALSQIISELNERFGLNLGPEHQLTLGQMMARLDEDSALDAAARANTRENVRLTFDLKVEAVIQEIYDANFDLYQRINDDPAFGEAVKGFLFEQYLRALQQRGGMGLGG